MTAPIKIYRQGRGETLNLLHGWGMNAAVFEPLALSLQNRFRVNRIDLPGYGFSGLQAETFDDQVEELAQAMDDGYLMAWSMGGLYALTLACRYPRRFPRLMLVGCNPCFVQRDDWPCAMPAEVFNEFAAALIDDWRGTIRRFIGLQMHGVNSSRELIRQITTLLIAGGSPSPRILKFGLELLLRRDERQAMSALEVPVMAVLGRRDKLVPASLCEHLAQINPSIAVKCLPRSAHAPFLSHQDVFVELLNEFVESSPAGQGRG